jgi:WD40 repeat protein
MSSAHSAPTGPAPSPNARQIRVFVSSTFRDMHAERDHLVTVVFPELRERLERLGLEFFDVDLRWGVPEKDVNGETANSWEYCRQWIDRVEPLFVCILGQRYGWVPQVGDFRDEADRTRQASVPRSITDLEVRHAVLHDRRKRSSYFYLRSAEAPANASEFVDPPPLADQLRQLKTDVRSCGRPVRDYPCAWTGSGFTGLEEFGRLVLEDLWSGVLRDPRYVSKEIWAQALGTDPDSDPRYTDESLPVPPELADKIVALAKPPPVSALEAERQQMESFAASRLRWFQGRTDELKRLTDFVRSTEEDSPRLAVVAAVPGQGKSALLAKLWQLLQPSGSPSLASSLSPLACDDALIVAHFVGATEHSASAMDLVRRLLAELDASGIEWPEEKTDEEPKLDFNSLCSRLAKRLGEHAGPRRIVLLIDALNQLSDGHDLLWLPHKLGPGVRVVVSCVDDSSTLGVPASAGLDRLKAGLRASGSLPGDSEGSPEQRVPKALANRQSESVRVPLGPLEPAEIRTVVTDYLREYCKELDTPHVDALCALPQASNPLYLLVALGELRTLGGNDMNRRVPELISEMPKTHPDTVSLFKWVLDRLEVFGTEEVKYWCLYLALGRVGMASRELADLLQRKLGEAAAAKALLIERGLRRYLQRRGGQLDFFHGQLRRAVMEKYGAENAEPSSRRDAETQRQNADRAEESCQQEATCPSDRHSAFRTPHSAILLHREIAEYFTARARGDDPQNPWKSDHVRGFAECIYHQASAKLWDDVERTLSDFGFLMQKTRLGLLEGLFDDWSILDALAPENTKPHLQISCAFFREKAHILRRGNAKWPAHKILLQLAVEHADDSPLTIGAEKWLAEGRSDWTWLRRNRRPPHAQSNPCLVVLEGHSGDIAGALVLSEDRIVSWAHADSNKREDHTLRLWNSRSGKCLAVLEGHADVVRNAMILSNGSFLTWASDNALRIWDRGRGNCLSILARHTAPVDGARVLPDGRILSWASDHTLRIWDDSTGKCLVSLRGHQACVADALILPDGRILSWAYDHTLRIWDSQSGECLVVFKGHPQGVEAALVLPDGRILSWTDPWQDRLCFLGKKPGDSTLRIWDSQSGKTLAVLEGHTAPVNGARVLPDGRILSWASDHTLRIWDSQSGKDLAVLEGHTDWVNDTRVLPDGRILSWASDHTLRIWDSQTEKCLLVLEGHTAGVSSAILLTDGRILSWAGGHGSQDHTLRLWDGSTGKCLAVLVGHTAVVSDVLILPNSRILSWTGGYEAKKDQTLRLWDATTGRPLAALEGHSGRVKGARVLPDGRILSWASDPCLRIWDSQTKTAPTDPEVFPSDASGAMVLPDGRILSWAGGHESKDHTLRIWDSQTEKCLLVLEGHTAGVSSAILLTDGRILSWASDRTLRIWDSRSGKCLFVLEGHSGWVLGVIVLPDGRILSWSWEHTLRIWDGAAGNCLALLEGHSEQIEDARVLSDGRILSWARGLERSEHQDRTLRVWDSAEGKCLAVLAGHSGSVGGALELPDGRILSWAGGYESNDHTLRIWDSQTGQCLAVLKGHTARIGGALGLADGRILSWTDKYREEHTVRVWDRQGRIVAVHDLDEGLRLFPDVQPVYEARGFHAQAPVSSRRTWKFLCSDDRELKQSRCHWEQTQNAGLLQLYSKRTVVGILWHGDSACSPRHLFADGRAILTQKNGHGCFLQLHHGNRPISIAELERLELGVEGRESLADDYGQQSQSHRQSTAAAVNPKKP